MTQKVERWRGIACAAFGLAVALAARPAAATHDEPGRGKALRTALVTAYKPCTNPNTVTEGGLPQPACSPPERSDPVCGFGPLSGMVGMGKAKGVVRNGDIELNVVLAGLGAGCEGLRLCGAVTVRVTTHRCPAPFSPCTAADIELTNLSDTACCKVANGNCKLKTTINTEVFDAIRPGQRAGIEVLGCGLRRRDGFEPPTGLTFKCGLLAP